MHSYVGQTNFVEQAGASLAYGRDDVARLVRTYRGKAGKLNDFLTSMPENQQDAEYTNLRIVSKDASVDGAYATVRVTFSGPKSSSIRFTPENPSRDDEKTRYGSAVLKVSGESVTVTYERKCFLISYQAATPPAAATSAAGRALAQASPDPQIRGWEPATATMPTKVIGETGHYIVYLVGRVVSAKPIGSRESPSYYIIKESWAKEIVAREAPAPQ